MADEYDLDWDDAFGGDIDFDDDFDMDPYKGKGFFSSLASGFLKGVGDRTFGSTDAVINTARAYLPRSFSNFFDNLSYWNASKDLLVREFEEQNYETVKSLQNIAAGISSRINDENSSLSQKLKDFSEKDFSSWEKLDVNRTEGLQQDNVNDDEVNEELGRMLDTQIQTLQNVGNGITQMQAHVGGGIMAVGKANGRELVGIQAGLRDLISYQQNVQYKMDRAKLEILTRTYLVNAKYYKFMEKALHTSIYELKEIAKNSKLSDYEKTSLYTESKAELRRGVLGVVRRRAGGLISRLTDMFGKSGREELYSSLAGIANDAEDFLGDGGSVQISKGLVGNVVGDRLSEMFVQFLPYLINQGPLADSIKNRIDANPRLKNGIGRLTDIGNLLSYNSNNGAELINYFSQYWKEFDTEQYEDYDDYAEQMAQQGKSPLPRALWSVINPLGNFAKEKANEFMWSTEKSQGTVYTLEKRNAADLTKVSQWREINNITLNDVIPGLLTRIYESIERFRTGNDEFESPTFSYVRGQFVNRNTARQLVKNDVFKHSNFQGIALTADRLVNIIDPEGKLSDEQRQQLAFDFIRRSDQQYGFNPYYYLNEMSDESSEDQQAINKLIFERFDIDEEKINAFNEANGFERAKIAATGFSGDAAERLNTLGDLTNTLKDSIPDVTRSFVANRQAGNDQYLRELGLINTRDGVDVFDTETIFNRIKEYLKDPNNPLLRGDIPEELTEQFSPTRRDFTRPTLPNLGSRDNVGESQEAFRSAVSDLTQGVKTLTDSLGNIDYSKITVNLDPIPDKLDNLKSVLDEINQHGDKQYALIEKMTSCVCRQSGGWGEKSDTDKKRIEEEEGQGKRSIMERLKALNPRGLFNRSIETLINNQPLVLGGLLGGLGTLAFANPKAAALIAGGMAISTAYGKLRNLSKGEEPSDDEDILDDTGTVILHAAKLRAGDYFDQVSKKVLTTWKDIKGAVFDIANKTYITLSQLTGRIFGADGRALIIRGLSRARDALNAAWDKIDIVGNARRAFDKGKELFYQQDIYVKGNKEPVLTRSGFMNGRYYCYDLNTKTPYPIKGWNEIEGPVYELSSDGTLNQVVSESDIATGLMTSSGASLDKLKSATRWLGSKGLEGLSKAKDFTLSKAGVIKEKAEGLLSNDYTGIESRLDRIYFLLCEQFGIAPRDIDVSNTGANPDMRRAMSENEDILDDVVDSVKSKPSSEQEDSRVKDKFSFASRYPNKVRLNSFEDKEARKDKESKDQFYDDIHAIREDLDGGLSSTDGKDKEKKGLFGKLTSMLLGGASMLKKLFTNPLGFMFDVGTKLLSSIFIKSPLRLAKIGSAIFSGVLGVASPIYKLLTWGFKGVMVALGKALSGVGLEGLGDWVGKRGRKKSRTGGPKRSRRRSIPGLGKWAGRGAKAGLAGYLAYELFGNSAQAAGFGEDYDDAEYDDYPMDESESDMFDEQTDKALAYQPSGTEDQGNLAANLATVGTGMAASRAAPELTSAMVRRLAPKLAAKAGARAVLGTNPIGAGVYAGIDGAMGFFDKEGIADTFESNYVNTRQRTANALTEVISLGGLLSPVGQGLASAVGLDSLAQDGGATRLLEKGMTLIGDTPLKYIPIFSITAKGVTSDASKPQRKIRLAMYGVQGTDNELGQVIETLEKQLAPFVRNVNNSVWIDTKAPVASILSPLVVTNEKGSNAEEVIRWYRQRFEPVFKLWHSATGVAHYNTLFDFDRSEEPSVLPVCKQVVAALVTLQPYPLDIVAHISLTIKLMVRHEADTMIQHYMKELMDAFKDRGVDENGFMDVGDDIRTAEEIREGTSTDTGVFASIRNKVQSWGSKLDELSLPPSPKIKEIDISDLHSSGRNGIDDLTRIRLAVYGNDRDNGIRVDAVLRLERYCEDFFTVQAGKSTFTGNPGEIFELFKNSFMVMGEPFTENWFTWFNNRFIPTLTIWVGENQRLQNSRPKLAWKSLSATNRLNIAIKMIELKTTSGKEDVSVWSVREAPFPWQQSTDDVSRTEAPLSNLKTKVTIALEKAPEKERESTQPKDLSDAPKSTLTKEQQETLNKKLRGDTGLNFNNSSSNNSFGNTNQSSVPNTTTHQNAFNQPGQGSSTPYDQGNIDDTKVNAPAAFPKNNTVGIKPNPGEDNGFAINPKMGEEIVLKELIKNGITDPKEQAFVLANISEESGNYKHTAENVNYSADRLMAVFKRIRDKGLGYAQRLVAGGKQAIANGLYANVNGNNKPGDGWLYRGRGFIQLTGKNNYKDIGNVIGEDLVSNPRRVSDDPEIAAKTAIGFIQKNNVLGKFRKGGFNDGVKAINGGYNGLQERKAAYQHYLQVLSNGSLKPKEGDDAGTDESTEGNNVPVTQPENPNDTVQSGSTKVNAPAQDGTEGAGDAPSLTTPAISMPESQPTPASTPEVNQVNNEPSTTSNNVESPAPSTPPPQRQPDPSPPGKQEVTLPEGTIKVQDDNVVSAISGLAEVLSRVLDTQGPPLRRVGVGPRQ